jgi:hypothetical protein
LFIIWFFYILHWAILGSGVQVYLSRTLFYLFCICLYFLENFYVVAEFLVPKFPFDGSAPAGHRLFPHLTAPVRPLRWTGMSCPSGWRIGSFIIGNIECLRIRRNLMPTSRSMDWPVAFCLPIERKTFVADPIARRVRLLVEERRVKRLFHRNVRGSGSLNIHQACAAESLALFTIPIWLSTSFSWWTTAIRNKSKVLANKTLEKLKSKYEIVEFIVADLAEYSMAGTSIEKWFHCTDLRTGPYHVSHLSDGLRFHQTLNKYGGYYFDL